MSLRHAVLSIAASLALAGLPASAEEPEPASLQGTVTLKGQPVKGVKIVFRGPDGKVVEMLTDDDGNFSLLNLPPGATTLSIETAGGTAPKNRGKQTSNQAKVNGVVTLDGKPIQDATLGFHPLNGPEQPGSAKTDAAGRYQLKLAPGTYKVTVSKGNLLPRYDDVTRTGLQAEIKEAKNEFNFDLRSR